MSRTRAQRMLERTRRAAQSGDPIRGVGASQRRARGPFTTSGPANRTDWLGTQTPASRGRNLIKGQELNGRGVANRRSIGEDVELRAIKARIRLGQPRVHCRRDQNTDHASFEQRLNDRVVPVLDTGQCQGASGPASRPGNQGQKFGTDIPRGKSMSNVSFPSATQPQLAE